MAGKAPTYTGPRQTTVANLLETAAAYMQAADQSIEHQLQTQSVQERTWGDVQERVQHHATMAAQKVKLDIGGRIFSTT